MKMIRPLKPLEIFAEEKVTRVDSLSLVLSGKWVQLKYIYKNIIMLKTKH